MFGIRQDFIWSWVMDVFALGGVFFGLWKFGMLDLFPACSALEFANFCYFREFGVSAWFGLI